MIPLRDSPQSRSLPWVTVGLILANIFVFLSVAQQGPEASRLLLPLTFVPRHFFYWRGGLLDWERWRPLLTAMFLHANLFHLVSNMWFLWVFGDNVEDQLGHGRYLLFYLVCGVASFVVQGLSAPTSLVPALGASGAISGVLGAYLLMFSSARILTLVPIIIIPWLVELPAFVFLGVWFLMQFFYGTASATGQGGVAWWAHIGGFLTGFVLCGLVRRPRAPSPTRRWVASGPRNAWLSR
ncbi:MAG: rhomboid family intramembrane serine protease [Myxococcaceae bacterium]